MSKITFSPSEGEATWERVTDAKLEEANIALSTPESNPLTTAHANIHDTDIRKRQVSESTANPAEFVVC
jgi:hypothetical protein